MAAWWRDEVAVSLLLLSGGPSSPAPIILSLQFCRRTVCSLCLMRAGGMWPLRLQRRCQTRRPHPEVLRLLLLCVLLRLLLDCCGCRCSAGC